MESLLFQLGAVAVNVAVGAVLVPVLRTYLRRRGWFRKVGGMLAGQRADGGTR